jgi:hypothetical protein
MRRGHVKDPQWAVDGGGKSLGEKKNRGQKTPKQGKTKMLEKETKPAKAVTQNPDGDRQEKRRTGPKAD